LKGSLKWADGGVIYIPLINGNIDNYIESEKLLSPFWQFLSKTGISDVADNAYYKWQLNNSEIKPPKYILGLYGTDCGNNLDLSVLPILISASGDAECDYLFNYTFEELDLDFRTSNN
jgi:hypothetical protein